MIDKMTDKKTLEVYRGKGCKGCFNSGYLGRIGITEMLILTSKVKEEILQRSGELEIKKMGRREGMTTMREDGLSKALEGSTTLEEVLRVTAPDEELK